MDTQDFLTLSTITDGEVGHPTLLIHDLNASLHDWDALIPDLVTSGHVTYACDLFGHGQSPHPADPRQYYAQMHLTAIRRWVDGLHLTRAPILIGHGFGAYLCLRYVLGHPYRVFRLVLINPLLMPAQLSPSVTKLERYPWADCLVEPYVPDMAARQVLGIQKGIPEALEKRIVAEALRSSPFNHRILPTIANLAPELASLPTRSLFILGEADPLFDMSPIPPLFENMTDIKIVSMPCAGHRPHLEAPEETNKQIISFLLGFK